MRSERLYREYGAPTHALVQIRTSESEPWAKVFVAELHKLNTSKRSSGYGLDVFVGLLDAMGSDNRFWGTQAGIALEGGWSESYLSRAVQRLVEGGYLAVITDERKRRGFFVNPKLACKVNPKRRRELLTEWKRTLQPVEETI